jgi:hypothetical protein
VQAQPQGSPFTQTPPHMQTSQNSVLQHTKMQAQSQTLVLSQIPPKHLQLLQSLSQTHAVHTQSPQVFGILSHDTPAQRHNAQPVPKQSRGTQFHTNAPGLGKVGASGKFNVGAVGALPLNTGIGIFVKPWNPIPELPLCEIITSVVSPTEKISTRYNLVSLPAL